MNRSIIYVINPLQFDLVVALIYYALKRCMRYVQNWADPKNWGEAKNGLSS